MQKVLNLVSIKIKQIFHNEYVRAFLAIFIIGLIAFGIVAARNNFTIPMSGDYTLQTYAFYSQGYHIFWNFIKTGEYPLYDFSNFLGANYLGTQSFYYVFSPLFYLLCLWPEKLLYQGIFFHMVFKFALGGFFTYVLLRKYFSVSKLLSFAGGFIYAYSGWALFYLWFHFGDIMAFFPVFIIGLERCLQERKGGILALGLFLCGMANYFFLVNFSIFGAVYALYRWISIYGINSKRGYSAKVRWGVLLQGILYCCAGAALAGICLLPSLEVASSATRTRTSEAYFLKLLSVFFTNPSWDDVFVLSEVKSFKDIFNGENLKELARILFIFEDRTASQTSVPSNVNVGYILSNWLYMNTNCWDNILFDNASLDNSIGGFFITTPLTMLLVPSIVHAFKSKRPWTIFGVIMGIAIPFFPITAHLAFGFTSLYGRWQLWLVLAGILFIIPTLDNFNKVDRRLVTVNLILNLILCSIVYAISLEHGKLPTGDTYKIFGIEVPGLILLSNIEIIIMFVVWFIYRFKIFKPAMVKRIMVGIIVLEIGASTVVTIENKGYAKWDTYYLSQEDYAELSEIVSELQSEDTDFYRLFNTDETRVIMNMPAALNYKSASTFNSTYNYSLDKFIRRSRACYSGSWTFGNHEKRYWYDQYISTKYYIIDKDDINNDNASYTKDDTASYDGKTSKNEEAQSYNLNIPFSYSLYKSYDYYDVYVNENYHGIGYGVSDYILSSSVGTSSKDASFYEELYTSAAIVEEEGQTICANNKFNAINSYSASLKSFSINNWDYYFSPREDISHYIEGNYDRQEYQMSGSKFTKKEISSLLPTSSQVSYGQRFHGRYVKYNYYGDELILKLKDDKDKLASGASEDNPCYLNINFKMGPNVLISLYNGDTLVTQDAHMNSNHSINKTSYEWKYQRGFYVDQPIDKIVIEFIGDADYEKVFSSDAIPDIKIDYTYKSSIDEKEKVIAQTKFNDVTYSNNKFTFTSNLETSMIGVTSIPYDTGWTLKINGKETEFFDVNGGFVGFIIPAGEVSYELSYLTPSLKEGASLSLGGLLLLIALGIIYKGKKVEYMVCKDALNIVYLKEREEEDKKDINSFKNKLNKFFKFLTKICKNIFNKIKKLFKKGRKK